MSIVTTQSGTAFKKFIFHFHRIQTSGIMAHTSVQGCLDRARDCVVIYLTRTPSDLQKHSSASILDRTASDLSTCSTISQASQPVPTTEKEAKVSRPPLSSSRERLPSDEHTPLCTSYATRSIALEWRVDQADPKREKRIHPSRSLVAAASSDTNSPMPRSLTSAHKPVPPASPSRRNSCTVKAIRVSSGNRFYAEVIRQRLKERKAHAAPPLARDLPKRDEQKDPQRDVKEQKDSWPLTPPSLSKRRRSLLEEGAAFAFARVPSSSMFTRTQSAEINAEFYQLSLTRPCEAQLIS